MASNNQQWQVLKRLFGYLGIYKRWTFLALLLLLLTSAIKSIIPLIASHFIDQYLTQTNNIVILFLMIYYSMYILQMILQYFGNYFFAKVSYSIVRDIRRDAFNSMQYFNMSYFDKTPTGTITSRITNDTEAISNMFSGILSSFVSAIFIFVLTLYTMLTLNVALTCLIILFLPIIIILINSYRKKSAVIIAKTRSLLGDINSKLAESIEGIRIIQAFGQEARLQREFDEINEKHFKFSRLSMSIDSIFLRPAMSLLKLLSYAVLMAYFGYTSNKIGVTAGMIYAFIQYINRLFDPLIEVTQNFSVLQTSMISASRVFDLIDDKHIEPKQGEQQICIQEGNIAFKHVSFSYDGKNNVLNDISFHVNKGETVAFVGATGSGKSSIINIFMRFYEFQSGEILIDGRDIRQFPIKNLRCNIGLVLQDPFLYHGTVKSNIAMYQNLTDEEIKTAAEFVDADSFIKKLPNGYDYPVSERGSSFSAGQRQLIAFSRTMATNPKILILDEATANIDSETENIVQESLQKMRQGRTTITIAHRLSTIQDANCIYVLEKGRIVESGTHEELLAKAGVYKRMYQLQSGMVD